MQQLPQEKKIKLLREEELDDFKKTTIKIKKDREKFRKRQEELDKKEAERQQADMVYREKRRQKMQKDESETEDEPSGGETESEPESIEKPKKKDIEKQSEADEIEQLKKEISEIKASKSVLDQTSVTLLDQVKFLHNRYPSELEILRFKKYVLLNVGRAKGIVTYIKRVVTKDKFATKKKNRVPNTEYYKVKQRQFNDEYGAFYYHTKSEIVKIKNRCHAVYQVNGHGHKRGEQCEEKLNKSNKLPYKNKLCKSHYDACKRSKSGPKPHINNLKKI